MFKELRWAELSGSETTDETITQLHACRRLEYLDVSYSSVKGETFAGLPNSLTTLRAERAPLSADGYKSLSKLSGLCVLSIGDPTLSSRHARQFLRELREVATV